MENETINHSDPANLPGFEAQYEAETHDLLIEHLRLSLKVGLFLYIGFYLLDYVSVPQDVSLSVFLIVRLSVLVVGACIIAATYWEKTEPFSLHCSVLLLLFASFGITYMSSLLGGFESDYYIGNMLILFFVGLFMPWHLGITLLFSLLMCIPYFALNMALFGPSLAMISPLFFLVGTSAFTCFSATARDKNRRRDLALRLQLELANDELKDLDEAKTRFFANVSHELRTPLMLIMGPLDSIKRGVDPTEIPPLVNAMASNAHRLLRQVNMILNFAQFEAGRMRCDAVRGNMGPILADLVQAAIPHANREGIALLSEGLETLPDTEFDPEKIETIAANLLSNALKFTKEGEQVTIRGWASGKHIFFEVSDTGIGIPESEKALIFDRFHQVDRGVLGKSLGTGLGLALSYELVKLHGGTVTVESEEGEGSTFRVELPLAPPIISDRRKRGRRREDRFLQAHMDTMLGEKYERQRSGAHTLLADILGPSLDNEPENKVVDNNAPLILVVEDNSDLKGFIVRSLSTTYRTISAENGKEGVELARQHRPDLILSDIMMPIMDGFQLVSSIQADPSLSRIPIILLTARSAEESIIKGLSAGAVDYVTKPFQIEELEARIAAQLRARATELTLDERETRLVAVGQMTSTIAHDLRGPLTAIVGHTSLAREVVSSSDDLSLLNEDLDAVEQAASRAVRMIEDVVTFVRGGDIALQRQETDMRRFITDSGKRLQDSVKELGIEVDINIAGEEGLTLFIDPDRFERIFENLFSNARDALMSASGPSDGATIFLSAEAYQQGLRIRIADNGPGIPEEVAERIFQPFETSGKADGTGLGLAIVRNIVTSHRGTVDFDSSCTEGGAAFTITLPNDTTT